MTNINGKVSCLLQVTSDFISNLIFEKSFIVIYLSSDLQKKKSKRIWDLIRMLPNLW
jgi:hypothetical protein